MITHKVISEDNPTAAENEAIRAVCRCGHYKTQHISDGERPTRSQCLHCSCGQYLRKRLAPHDEEWTPAFKSRCLSAIETAILSEDGLDGLEGEAILRAIGKWPPVSRDARPLRQEEIEQEKESD